MAFWVTTTFVRVTVMSTVNIATTFSKKMIKTSFLIGFAMPTFLFVRLVGRLTVEFLIARRKREEAKHLYKKAKDA